MTTEHQTAETRADPLEELRLPLKDELLDAGHEVAAFLHGLIWGDVPHYDEPGDGSDCHECYDQTDRLFEVIVRAAPHSRSTRP